MTDLLSRAAANSPTGIFLEDPSGSVTFFEAEDAVTRRAKVLGDRTGEQLAVEPRIAVESVIDLLATLRCGATAVVVSRQLTDQADGGRIEQASKDRRPCHSILFTSGSAGGSKGVRFSAANWEAAGAASMSSLGHGAGDRWLCPLPLHHVGGLSIVFRSLAAGGHVMLAPDLEHAFRWLDRVQFASLVPTQLHRILLRRSEAFAASPRVLVGGGPVDEQLLNESSTAGLIVLPTYGMTETTSQVATARPGDPQRRLFPLAGVEVRIGAEGRIEVKGPTVALGYVGEPEHSQDDWFSTSDRGRIEQDGSLAVLRRLDLVIISGGEKVDPAEVEAAIASVPGVRDVAVTGLPDREWGQLVAAAYVGDISPDDLRQRLKDRLPAYAVPKNLLQVDALPRTELGKIDQVLLASLFT